jgi:hypothetical protein
MAVSPEAPVTGEVDEQFNFDVSGVVADQAYRITLVSADVLTVDADGVGTFTDADANGAADPGPSEETALLFQVLYNPITPNAKTYPAGNDDPAMPSGIFAVDGEVEIGFGVTGVGAGTVYPVIYWNGGESTFLEIDENGMAIEPYVIGPAITINAAPEPPPITIAPATPVTVAPAEEYDYTISGLDNAYYYRVTLVHGDNVTTTGPGMATFVDAGAGTANAGPSEEVALISYSQGAVVDPGAKTLPAGTDDPANPTGIQPVNGEITVSIMGVADGTIYPVAYRNGGTSTFLEIDTLGAPVETYIVGGSLTVATP